MFRENFSHHVKNADWFTVVIELLVVLLGVYGAFQLERWGEERRESHIERVLLEQLQSEIVIAEPLMENQLQVNRDTINGIREVASLLIQPVGSGELDKAQCSVVLKVSTLPWNPLTLTALDEMVSGDMHSQLDDRELRTLLFSLQAAMQNMSLEMQLVRPLQKHLTDVYPHLLTRGFGSDGKQFLNCNTGEIRTNQSFMNHLVSNYGRLAAVNYGLEQELEALKAVHRRLDQVLGSSGD